MSEQPPPGFEPFPFQSPFLELIGPLWLRQNGPGAPPTIGLRIRREHANNRGLVHGGVLATLADIVLGYGVALSTEPQVRATTASLSIDYAASAEVGDWVEGTADVQRIGAHLVFVSTFLETGGKRIARASGVFGRRA